MAKKKSSIIVILSVLLIIAALTIFKINDIQSKESEQGGFGRGALGVEVKVLNGENLDKNIYSSGSILSDEEVELRAETSGKVISINFNEGRPVNKGDLLVKINDDELQAQLKIAKADLELAKEKEFRQKKLLEKQGISREAYDEIVNQRKNLEAEIELLNAKIDKTEIKAPFSGIIGFRHISEGAYVTPQTQIASMQKVNPVKLEFSVPQKYFDIVKTGTEINFRIPANDKSYAAKIYAIEPKIDKATRTLLIRARCDNSDRTLMPGAYAEIELLLDEISNAIMIPTQALIPDLKSEKVFVYSSGKAVPRMVQTGIRSDKEVQIIDGLNPGDTLITSGIINLRPGLDVKIEKEN